VKSRQNSSRSLSPDRTLLSITDTKPENGQVFVPSRSKEERERFAEIALQFTFLCIELFFMTELRFALFWKRQVQKVLLSPWRVLSCRPMLS